MTPFITFVNQFVQDMDHSLSIAELKGHHRRWTKAIQTNTEMSQSEKAFAVVMLDQSFTAHMTPSFAP